MKVCQNCGEKLKDECKFCTNCGSLLEETVSTISSMKKDVAQEIEEENEREEEIQDDNNKVKTTHLEKQTTALELWSWLKKDSKRQMFLTDNDITEEEFVEKVTEQMSKNNIRAKIEKKKIIWDRSSVEKEYYLIRPDVNVENPVSYLLQLRHVGKFAFVEEKTFITPPDLPKVPGIPKRNDSNPKTAILMILIGLLVMFMGVGQMASAYNSDNMVATFIMLVGIILACAGVGFIYQYISIKKYNEECMEEKREWDLTWQEWEDSIFLYSFQEDINGQMSRIFESVIASIKQVSDEVFNEKAAVEEESTQKMNELEQMIQRRKDEYK